MVSPDYCLLRTGICLPTDAWAAWAQAGLAVLAIVASVAVVYWQTERQNRQTREAARAAAAAKATAFQTLAEQVIRTMEYAIRTLAQSGESTDAMRRGMRRDRSDVGPDVDRLTNFPLQDFADRTMVLRAAEATAAAVWNVQATEDALEGYSDQIVYTQAYAEMRQSMAVCNAAMGKFAAAAAEADRRLNPRPSYATARRASR